MDIEKVKKEIPSDYHFLLENRLHDTNEMKDVLRVEALHKLEFNRCEQCGYNMLEKSAYESIHQGSKLYPKNGYVHYFHHHKLILCDRCVDSKNGTPWIEEN